MMRQLLLAVVPLRLLLSTAGASPTIVGAQTMSLDGEWDFVLSAPAQSGKIMVMEHSLLMPPALTKSLSLLAASSDSWMLGGTGLWQ